VVCTAIAFLLFAALIDEIGPVRAAVITYVNPAVAAALGVAVQRDPFTAAMGLGFLLVILGSAFAARSPTMSTADGRVDVGDDRPPAAGVDEVVA
jgi:drug/metabolite transporter (DMT)-like permease